MHWGKGPQAQAPILAPRQELPRGARVGGAGPVDGDLRREELHEVLSGGRPRLDDDRRQPDRRLSCDRRRCR